MSEFSSRVEAQRRILKVVNEYAWPSEQLFALNSGAIQRWATGNLVDHSSSLYRLLNAASSEIFVMANHSDDPIAGTYAITRRRVEQIEKEVRSVIVALQANS